MPDPDFSPGMPPTSLNDLQVYLLSRENRTAAKHKLIRAAFEKRQWNVIVAQVLQLEVMDITPGAHKLVHACRDAVDHALADAILAQWDAFFARESEISVIGVGNLVEVVGRRASVITQSQADSLIGCTHFQNIPVAISVLANRGVMPSAAALQAATTRFEESCYFDGMKHQMTNALARLQARQIEKALEGARPTRSDVQVDGAGL